MPLSGQEHIDRYVATDGREGHDRQGTQTVILTTTGRRSGQARPYALVYGRHGDDYLVVKGDKMRARARTATPEEQQKLWPIMTSEWPDYDRYQEKRTATFQWSPSSPTRAADADGFR